jgi:hypothetical protein
MFFAISLWYEDFPQTTDEEVCDLLLNAFKIVPAGHRAVVFNNLTGGLSGRGEGLTLLLPFTQSATIYDVRTQTYTMSNMTSEGQVRGDDSVQSLTKSEQPRFGHSSSEL